MISQIEKNIKKFLHPDFILKSRIHKLKSFDTPVLKTFVKRDDELGMMGSKMRKFSSIIAYLLEHAYKEVLVIGGANSNHVLGITQLLIENEITPRLFLCETHQESIKGNGLLTKLLVPSKQILWIPRKQWHQVEELANDFKCSKQSIFILKEGGCQAEALPGALTLPLDIVRNEQKTGFQFDHLFIDSGTGMMAIGLLLGLTFLKHSGHLHVLLVAGTEKEFLEKLKIYHQKFSSIIGQACPWPSQFSLSRPIQAKAFGSVTAKTFQTIQQMAQVEGVLCDPIYNAKLFLEVKQKILDNNLKGNALVIQSGGTSSLYGFLSLLSRESRH